ncbi:MAG: MarR family transcriptional regulator [Solirubrobacterales bacterium]|nr:MarR family transcriptional regulator [Solirubrobacterales bacterium]
MSGTSTESRTARVDFIAEHLLSRAALLVRLLVKQVHSREVSRTELEVLSILTEGPRRVTELAELEGVAQPTMTLLVKRLEDKGWVHREGLPDDGRVVMIAITDAGSAAQQTFREQFLGALRTDLRGLTARQLDELAAAAATVSSFVDELQQRAGK